MFLMLSIILGIDQNIVDEYHDKHIKIFHEHLIHQIHKAVRLHGQARHAEGQRRQVRGCGARHITPWRPRVAMRAQATDDMAPRQGHGNEGVHAFQHGRDFHVHGACMYSCMTTPLLWLGKRAWPINHDTELDHISAVSAPRRQRSTHVGAKICDAELCYLGATVLWSICFDKQLKHSSSSLTFSSPGPVRSLH